MSLWVFYSCTCAFLCHCDMAVSTHLCVVCLLFCCPMSLLQLGGGGRGLLPYKKLRGMCCWMGSHFHDWIDYNGVAFLIELLGWGRTFSDFMGKTVLRIYI